MADEPGTEDDVGTDGHPVADDDGFRSFGDGDASFIDPASAVSGGDTGGRGNDNPSGSGGATPGKRRGRKPGSTNKTKTTSLDLSSIENLLLTIHTGISVLLKAPEFELTDEEAHKIAEAGTRVSRHYNMSATAKSVDFANFAIVLGTAYGSRFMAMKMRRDMERRGAAQASKERTANVVDFGQIPPNQVILS